MKEMNRTSFGMTDKGAVFLIEKGGSPGSGGVMQETTFEVRHGVRTVGVFDTFARAKEVASAIAGKSK